MKVLCAKNNLVKNISLAEKVSGKNLTLPVLNCLLLIAEKNILKIRATNLNLGIEIEIPCKVEKEGIVAVPGNIIHNALSFHFGEDTIILETQNNNLAFSTPTGTTVIKSFPHDDFPTLPSIMDAHTFMVKRDDLLRGFKGVWYSASVGTIKPELSSIYVFSSDKRMFFVATDSFRLAEKSIRLDTATDFESFLIPFRNIPEILRVLENAEEVITVYINKNQISFVFDKVYLTSRLIDGVFPDYKQIIPKKHTTEAVVLKQDLAQILKKTTIFSDEFNQINLQLNPSKKSLVVYSNNTEVGETTDTLGAALSGETLAISFNHKYITDCLSSINADSISLSFSGLNKPMIMRGVSDDSFLYLVMPMNK